MSIFKGLNGFEWTPAFGWNGNLIVLSLNGNLIVFSPNGNLSGLDWNGNLAVVGMDI